MPSPYRKWCHHPTESDAITLQYVTPSPYRKWCHHPTEGDAIPLQKVTPSPYRKWCHHPTESDAITLQKVTPSPHRKWCHHPKESDAITLQKVTPLLADSDKAKKETKLALRQNYEWTNSFSDLAKVYFLGRQSLCICVVHVYLRRFQLDSTNTVKNATLVWCWCHMGITVAIKNIFVSLLETFLFFILVSMTAVSIKFKRFNIKTLYDTTTDVFINSLIL